MEAGEYGLTRGTCFVAHRVEVAAVAGLLWISWCVFGGAFFFRVFHEFSSSNWFTDVYTTAGCERPRAGSVDSVNGLRQTSNLPAENSYPPMPTRCTTYAFPTSEIWRHQLISKVAHSSSSQFDQCPHECNLNNFSSFESASSHCSRDRAIRQTYA